MKKLKFLFRFCYIVIIVALLCWFIPVICHLGANPKSHSEIKASIRMLLADQPVDAERRSHVISFFNQRFSNGRGQFLYFDPLPLLEKIRNGEKLNDENKKQLSKMSDVAPN